MTDGRPARSLYHGSQPATQAVFVEPEVPIKHRERKSQEKLMRIREDDEASSINAEDQSDFSQIFEADQNIPGGAGDFGGATGGIDSEDSAAMIKKSKNREAAKNSRQKKRAEFEQF